MVYLITDGISAGVAQTQEIRTPYATVEAAQAQAEHDATMGRRPLRIVDANTDDILWDAPS